MARTKSGNLTGRAAATELAQQRQELLEDLLANPSDQDRRIGRMLGYLRIIYGQEMVIEFRKDMSMLNHILEPQLAALFLMKGITIEGDDLLTDEVLGSLVGKRLYREIREEANVKEFLSSK